MDLKINRKQTTRLYTTGELSVNGQATTSTVEATINMLPAGTYDVQLHYGAQRRRQIAILAQPIAGMKHVPNTLMHFEACGSWLSAKKNRSICIGQPLIPGALSKGTEPFERLFDRIEKAEKRHEHITLTISDTDATHGEPISHWLS